MKKADEYGDAYDSNEAWLGSKHAVRPADEAAGDMSGPDVAKHLGVTPRALRFYESRGLISPRREGRARIYSQVDRRRIGLILKAKKLGFTLTEIGPMISVRDNGGATPGLQLTAAKCLKQIGHLESQMKSTAEALADLQQIHLDLCRKAGRTASE
jgi:DNA-binding transcriptional MerR regulator